jgi:hypothetical protein
VLSIKIKPAITINFFYNGLLLHLSNKKPFIPGGNMRLRVGKTAPDFVLKSHLGNIVRLSSYRTRCNVVLAFFPLAWTPI